MLVNRENLLSLLDQVTPGLSKKEVLEQSGSFAFINGRLLTYNDEITCRVPTEIDFKCAVPATPLLALLRKLNDEEVDIELQDGKDDGKTQLVIKGARRRAGIAVERNVLLPLDAIEKPTGWHKVGKKFAEAADTVCTCAGKDVTKFQMTCVHITPDYMEACDNYQAIRYKFKTPVSEPMLIRASSLREVCMHEITKMCEEPNWVHFKTRSSLTISCRLSRVKYKSLEEPLSADGQPVDLPKALSSAVDRASIFSSESSDANLVSVKLAGTILEIEGRGPSGWYKERQPVKYDGPDLHFAIGPKMLIDVSKRHSSCVVGSNVLKVDVGSYVFVTSLKRVDE